MDHLTAAKASCARVAANHRDAVETFADFSDVTIQHLEGII